MREVARGELKATKLSERIIRIFDCDLEAYIARKQSNDDVETQR